MLPRQKCKVQRTSYFTRIRDCEAFSNISLGDQKVTSKLPGQACQMQGRIPSAVTQPSDIPARRRLNVQTMEVANDTYIQSKFSKKV